jgi:hypothetical protein
MATNEWETLLENLKGAKANKVSFPVPKLGVMLFAGAFDDFIPPGMSRSINTYRFMFEEIKKALKSTAKLPKKTKTESVDLNDGDLTPLKLMLWRQDVNPVCASDVLNLYRAKIISDYGFLTAHPDIDHFHFVEMAGPSKKNDKVINHLVINTAEAMDQFLLYKDGMKQLHIFGLVESRTFKKFGKDSPQRTRMILTLNTGHGITPPITVWPNKNGVVDPYHLAVYTVGKPVLMHISVKDWQGSPSLSLAPGGTLWLALGN